MIALAKDLKIKQLTEYAASLMSGQLFFKTDYGRKTLLMNIHDTI